MDPNHGQNHLKIGLGAIEAVWWNGARYALNSKAPSTWQEPLGFNIGEANDNLGSLLKMHALRLSKTPNSIDQISLS